MERILVVEDEPKLAELLRQHLTHAGYEADCLHDGNEVEAWVRAHSPDLILLDLMLPGKDGLDLCREIRSKSNVPIIMLTARVDETDRLLGLELGADDYVCKPYSPREVVARVKAVLRRGTNPTNMLTEAGQSLSFGAIQIDRSRFSCHVGETAVVLTPVEFRLLEALMQQAGQVLSRSRLMDVSYEDQRVVSDRTVDSHIKNLRKKLAEASDIDPIQSIYGVGYRLQ